MLTDELLTSLFDGQPHALAASMAAWLASSRRFTAFVTANHAKIRKKLHSPQEPEALRDIQLELETAYLLLREHALSLTYEPQHPELGRSPDFAVTFTTSLVFMVEVTRLHASSTSTPGPPLLSDRFTDMLCSKLGQLLPKRGNVLVVGLESSPPLLADIHTAMLRIQRRAEASDPALLQKQGFHDRADFFRYYLRLSALLVRSTTLRSGGHAILWVNPQARHPLPAKVITALSRSHTL